MLISCVARSCYCKQTSGSILNCSVAFIHASETFGNVVAVECSVLNIVLLSPVLDAWIRCGSLSGTATSVMSKSGGINSSRVFMWLLS